MAEVMGWISVHRQIQDHWLWDDKPYSFGQAWIDMLLLANHSDNKFPLGKEIVMIPRGSFITSELKLTERWGWSKTKVRRFLELLENDSMIIKKTDRKKTTITIENYSDYQDLETTKKPKKNQKKTDKEPIKDHSETDKRPIKNTNNNDNNDNNDNNVNNYIYIVEYLNEKAGTKYRTSSQKTRTCIRARLSEGFTLDDFKCVIDKKCAEWLGTEWEKFLRPETLFGTKFESYLNAKVVKAKTGRKEIVPDWMNKPATSRDYDMDELEKKLLAKNTFLGKESEDP